nr:MAG TPA: helix-turn-helix domain-containing protein [Caudoviricetes sp.]
MKAVLLSIKPNWCKLIWSGMKTVDVRKTRPKLETPFKVYIYCTRTASKEFILDDDNWDVSAKKHGGWPGKRGRVIGEFTCKKITGLTHVGKTGSWESASLYVMAPGSYYKPADELLETACMSKETAEKYLKGRDGYGWHISDLKIYDKPVKRKDFWAIQPCTHRGDCCTCRRWDAKKLICRGEAFGIERPPQSWYYVEDYR